MLTAISKTKDMISLLNASLLLLLTALLHRDAMERGFEVQHLEMLLL